MPKRQSESTIAPTPHFMFSSGLGNDIKVSGVAINRQSHIFEDNLSESLGAMCLANATKVLSDDLKEAADATLPADETATRAIAPGARVELYGLQKVIELNGKHGVAEQWDAAIERWEVRLDGDPIDGCCKQRLREANLAVMACIASAESPGSRAEFSALSADELRGRLTAHGVEHGACAETAALVELLLAGAAAPPPASAAFAAAAGEGAPMAASAALTS